MNEFNTIRRRLAIEQAPTDLNAIVDQIDAALSVLIRQPGNFDAIGDLARVSGRLKAMHNALMGEISL